MVSFDSQGRFSDSFLEDKRIFVRKIPDTNHYGRKERPVDFEKEAVFNWRCFFDFMNTKDLSRTALVEKILQSYQNVVNVYDILIGTEHIQIYATWDIYPRDIKENSTKAIMLEFNSKKAKEEFLTLFKMSR